jgi:hypothetical protein
VKKVVIIMRIIYQITDDSGFLSIINPDQYKWFVDVDWDFEQLMDHFKQEESKENMIFWETGAEGVHLVEIRFGISNDTGFKVINRTIRVTSESLCLINYETLASMASELGSLFPLPEFMKEYLFRLENGLYHVRLIQLDDPDDEFSVEYEEGFRFRVELQKLD